MNYKEFCVLIPQPMTEKGHHFSYNRAVQKAIELLKGDFRAFVSQSCDVPDLPLKWQKVFPRRYGLGARWWNVLLRLRCYCQLFHQQNASRTFFLEWFNALELSLAATAAIVFLKKPHSFWIVHRFTIAGSETYRKIIRFWCFLLRVRFADKFLEFTDSTIIQNELQEKYNRKITLLPIPHTRIPTQMIKKPIRNKLECWWPGEARVGKGLMEIQQLLLSTPPMACAMEIVASELAPFIAASESSITLKTIPAVLSRNAYECQLFSSDCILLPYDPLGYRENTSGIFVEAICAEKMPFVRGGSWLAAELKAYDLDELILDWTSQTLAQDIYNLFQRPDLHAKLRSMSQYYQSFHSVEQFAKIIQPLLMT